MLISIPFFFASKAEDHLAPTWITHCTGSSGSEDAAPSQDEVAISATVNPSSEDTLGVVYWRAMVCVWDLKIYLVLKSD
jgi:hypothetical protein